MALTTRHTNRLFLLEVAMALALIALSIVLYMRPAANDMSSSVEWWNWILLAALFFGVVGVHSRRKRYEGREALRDALSEDVGGSDPPSI